MSGSIEPSAISTATDSYELTQRHQNVDEKDHIGSAVTTTKDGTLEYVDDKIVAVSDSDSEIVDKYDDGIRNNDNIIITGADVANKMLSLRDDRDPALTFRSIFLCTILSAFQAAISQIYQFKPTYITLQGTFLGIAWAWVLPRGDRLKARFREANGGSVAYPLGIKIAAFINPGPFGLKEHAVCSITANSASNAAATTFVYASQSLFYNLPITATNVVLTIISVGIFGYGLSGLMRPFTLADTESVFWSNLPLVKALQGLHWQQVKDSKPLRSYWYAFAGMFVWEWFPGYMWPWLNSISIPCLAAMKATGDKAAVLTNLFGGSLNNEGLGLFSVSLDWQYITSQQTSYPLKFQYHQAIGLFACYLAMVGIYYSNTWDALSQPFMSTRLRSENGTKYPIDKVFVNGILDESAVELYGPPRLSATFVWSMFIANAAIGAMISHFIFFWGKEVWQGIRNKKEESKVDRHHRYMRENYPEAPAWWYVVCLVIAFVFGLVVVLKENITLTVGPYIVSLVVGAIIAPVSTLLLAKFGNGIATNNLSKLIGGLILPGRPIGNMYFACWSHTTVSNAVTLSQDLKMGEYLKIPPRVMFLTQVYGTIIGGFVNYAVMISILNNNRDVLIDGNGNAGWSGATMQAFTTTAASWSMSKYLYKTGAPYSIVPIGLAIGFGLVAVHRLIVHFIPRIGKFHLDEINLPTFIQYAGYIPYNQSQTCILFSLVISGFYGQFYLRNYKPRWYQDYFFTVTAGFDAAAYTALFIMAFAVFGGSSKPYPFPSWWGNNVEGNYDLCPVPS